jgi:hypothetical protein
MAITNASKTKEFIAGSSPIILKGDYRRKEPETKMASAPDIDDSRNELSLQLFGKPVKLLTPEEMDMLNNEAERLMQKFMADGGRAQYGLGSLVKSIKKTAKKVVKSPIGKAALLYTGVGALGNLAGGRALFSNFLSPTSFIGGASDIFKKDALTNILNLTGDKKGTGAAIDALKISGVGAAITGLLADMEQRPDETPEQFANRQAQVKEQLGVQFKRLYPQEGNESDEDYNIRISAMVESADDQTIPVGNMAEGGRVNRAMGSDEKVEMAAGIEGLPINVNSKGVKEVDLRETGGFIPPVGIKEKADDIPAMLSNNEFVFTADAVRAAGGGSVNKGAQRMYDLMKNLESKVV